MLSNNNFCMYSFNSISASLVLLTGISVRYTEFIDANKSLTTVNYNNN